MAPEVVNVPEIPNPDARVWHALTLEWWSRVWASPMASQYVESDIVGLGRLAVIVDEFNVHPDVKTLGEIRLQEARFGLSPLDRTRLQWEIAKTDEIERKRAKPEKSLRTDPRIALVPKLHESDSKFGKGE